MSKEVKRYGMCGFESGIVEMEDGPYVDSDDYDALLAERDALMELVEAANNNCRVAAGYLSKYRPTLAQTSISCCDEIDAALQGAQP